MGALREKMEREMKLKKYAPKTLQAYTGAVYGLAKYYNKSPDLLSNEEVQEYILSLIGKSSSWSTCNVAKEQAGIRRGKGIHTLRHAFATHLLTDLRSIIKGSCGILKIVGPVDKLQWSLSNTATERKGI